MKTKPTLHFSRTAASILAGLTLISAAPKAHAASYTWALAGSGTWNTTTANWNDGVTNPTTWVNGTSSDAVFSISESPIIKVSGTVTANSLTVLGTSAYSIQFSGSPIDVSTIYTSSAAINMYSILTGSHGLTYSSTGGGRLNLKNQATYTGATILTGSAYLLSDAVSNALPTATTLNLGAGTTFRMANSVGQQVGLLTGSGTVIAQSSAANTSTFTINTAAGTSGTFSGTIKVNSSTVDTLNLVVSGSGSQTLNGTNSYNGTTAISGGVLILGSSLTATKSVAITGGTLQSSAANITLGVGSVSMSSGVINPGDIGVTGTFTLAANQNFTTTGGSIEIDLGTSSDLITGSGTGTFSLSDIELVLNLISGFDYTDTYSVFSGFSSGTYSNITITGYDTANYTAILDADGVLSFTAVPEPATWVLLAAGTLGCAFLRRRKTVQG